MYNIICTPHYYQGTLGAGQQSIVRDDDGEILEFETREDAQAWIDEQNEGVYYLSHGEYARPEYKIIEDGTIEIDDCAQASADILGDDWIEISADDVPQSIKDILDSSNVEDIGKYDDTTATYTAYTQDDKYQYAVIFEPRHIALDINADDLGNLDWDHQAYARREL